MQDHYHYHMTKVDEIRGASEIRSTTVPTIFHHPIEKNKGALEQNIPQQAKNALYY